MLGRKDYTRQEFDDCKAAVGGQLAAYRRLADAAGSGNGAIGGALEGFQARFFNNMVIVLDRYFVHRIRPVTGKDANPLNEVEQLAESLINNGGVLRFPKVIKWNPQETVLGLEAGDRIQLDESQFEKLSAAFLAEIERRFVAAR